MDRWTSLALAARMDEAAGDELVALAYDQVWRCCAGLVDRSAADELAQETFARAMGGLDSLPPEASGRTWLLSLARGACTDELRSRRRRQRRAAPRRLVRRSRPPVLRVVGSGPGLVVDELLGHLDADQRSAFVLTQLVGLSYQEAAAVCRCSEPAIRSRVAAARVALVGHLGRPGRGGRAGSDRGARER